jgi:hypothetical protein
MSRNDESNFSLQPDIVLIGPQLSRVNIRVNKQLRAIRVDFQAGGMYRMLGIPMHEMCDEGFDALDFFGAEMMEVNNRLQEALPRLWRMQGPIF